MTYTGTYLSPKTKILEFFIFELVGACIMVNIPVKSPDNVVSFNCLELQEIPLYTLNI
jgi:hypothetical protein